MSRELITALDAFIQNFYHGESLTDAQARKNLEEGVIELVWRNGQHAANGLLVTESGYILTSNHCVEESHLSGLQVKNHNNICYEIEKVQVRSKGNLDLALVKANIPQKDIAKQYRFYDLKLDYFAVAAFTRKEGLPVKKYGFAEKTNKIVRYNFPDGAPGDSGGVIATPDSEIMAIYCGKIDGYDSVYSAFTVSLFKALELIHFYKRRLESRL